MREYRIYVAYMVLSWLLLSYEGSLGWWATLLQCIIIWYRRNALCLRRLHFRRSSDHTSSCSLDVRWDHYVWCLSVIALFVVFDNMLQVCIWIWHSVNEELWWMLPVCVWRQLCCNLLLSTWSLNSFWGHSIKIYWCLAILSRPRRLVIHTIRQSLRVGSWIRDRSLQVIDRLRHGLFIL